MSESLRTSRSVLWLVAAAACWGSGTIASKRAVDEITPLALLAIQLAVSVAALAVLTSVRQGRLRWSPDLRRVGALGILNPGVSYLLSLLGLAQITASLSVLLWSAEPLLILTLAWCLLGERVTGLQAIAMVLACAGVVLVVFEGSTSGDAIGAGLTLAGVGACAVYTVLSSKLMGTDPPLTIVLVQQAFALVFALGMLGVAATAGALPPVSGISGTAWASAATSGLLYYAVAFWLYLSGLRGVPASTAGVFINLVPVFGIAVGHLMLAERLTARQWLGAAVVVAAVTSVALLRAAPARTRWLTRSLSRSDAPPGA